MNANTQPIQRLEVFSTGTAQQHREHHFGSRMPKLWWVLMGRRWVKVPINVFVIKHSKGLVLFDTGLDPAITSNQNYISQAIGQFLLPRIFKLHITPEDSLPNQLKRLDYSNFAVHTVVISHLHFDHVGGIKHLPQARLLVGRDEWQQLNQPHPEHNWILKEHIELPNAHWHPIEFMPTKDPVLSSFGASYDVMGDGTMVLLPTPGHTPGSLSLLIRSEGYKPILLVGDLNYSTDLLMKDQLPGVYWDGEILKSSFAKVRALKKALPNLVIIASHELNAKALLASAKTSSKVEEAAEA